jgi:hypothetical protein
VPDERIAKYTAWLSELEARQRDLDARRPRLERIFLGALVASSGGFLWNLWIGAATLFTGVLVFVFGFYTLRVRARDYRSEIAQTRATLEDLRGERTG